MSIASCFSRTGFPAGRRKGRWQPERAGVAPTSWRFSWGFPAFKLLAVFMTQCRSSRLPTLLRSSNSESRWSSSQFIPKLPTLLHSVPQGPCNWPQWIPPGFHVLLATNPPLLSAYVRLGGSSSKYPIRIPTMDIHHPNYPSVPFAQDNLILHSSRRNGVLGLRGWEFPLPWPQTQAMAL